jgi:DNA-binding transcriptional LysR family regulator
VVGSPSYFKRFGLPASPRELATHNCIMMRLPTYGGLFPWGLEKDGKEVKVRGEGQLVFNNLTMRVQSVLDGLGLAYLPEDQALPHIRKGRLVRVLEDWCPPFAGYHLYYPSRRHFSPALSVLVDVLRYRD